MKQLYIKYLFLFFYINLPTFIDEEPIFEKYGIEVNEIKIDKNLDLMTFDTNNRWIDHKNELFQDLMSIDTVTKISIL